MRNTHINLLILFFTLTISAQKFTKVTEGDAVNDGGDSRAVNWIDFNMDGKLDLFITNGPQGGQNNFLYFQSDDGVLIKVENISPVLDNSASDGSTWGDYNNDSHPDLFVATWWNEQNLLYSNNGNSTFTFENGSIPSQEKSYSETASWGDVNNDGYLDLFVCNSGGSRQNFLYLNNGDGRFTKIDTGHITEDQNTSRNIDWIDLNGDDFVDAFVSNEGNQNNALYINNGDGSFTKNIEPAIANDGGESFGSSWGDIDNDGDFDLFVANHGNQKNFLYINEGNLQFTKITEGDVVNDNSYSIGSDFADVDNDGDLDLFVANGFSGGSKTTNLLYLNNGDGTFTKENNVVTQDDGWSYGTSFGDLNSDGYLDLAIAKCYNANENNAIYLNDGGENNWILINVHGSVSNGSAIGSVVRLKANIFGNDVWQTRRIAGQSGYSGQNLQVHFGLGDAAVVDSIIVKYPSGQSEVSTGINVNTVLALNENLPSDFIRANFKADTLTAESSLTVQFTDLSLSGTSITNYAWDFNDDGIVDSEEQNPTWTFESDTAKRYPVHLSIDNNSSSDEKTREDYVSLTGLLPNIMFDTQTSVLESFPIDTDSVEVELVIYNYGNGSDIITTEIDYRTVDVEEALKLSSQEFEIAANDSQVVTLKIYPSLLTPSSSFYSFQVILISENNPDQTEFAKGFRFKVIEPTSVDNTKKLTFQLYQNYPNPFNPSTRITYSMPKPDKVRLVVYDILGNEIAELVNAYVPDGQHEVEWKGKNKSGQQVSSGVYFYSLISGERKIVKKMFLVK